MTSKYEQFYELQEFLSGNPRLVQSQKLYNFDTNLLYAAALDRLAQPMPSGEQSPFSSRSPMSAHAIFMAEVIQQLAYYGHEINLMPDKTIINFFRLLGAEVAPAEYPIVNMRFWRSQESLTRGLDAIIDGDIEIRSSIDSNLRVYTQFGGIITGSDTYVDIPARLNQEGIISPDIQPGEFSVLFNYPPFVDRVENVGILSQGRKAETLVETMLRVQGGIRTGNIGRFYEQGLADFQNTYLGRSVTIRDYQYYALQLGAQQATVLQGYTQGSDGYLPDITTVAVYPGDTATYIQEVLLNIVILGQRLSVIEAEIVPVTGTIYLSITPTLSFSQAITLANEAITNKVNPPNGVWGDRQFKTTLSTALEMIQGVYAVPSVDLKNATTGETIDFTQSSPWQLYKIQNTITYKIQN